MAAAPVGPTFLSHASAGIEMPAADGEAVAPLASAQPAPAPAPVPADAEVAGHTLAAAATGLFDTINTIVSPQAPLSAMVEAYGSDVTLDREQECLAGAVYFEARGEPVEGQLAVADVVINRSRSGRYPASLCGVVLQPWQFSFVNATGRIPNPDRNSIAWKKAVAISRIAQDKLARQVPSNVLWYHADYVAPSWGRRLTKVDKIGLHIFYS